ncbi:MAG: ribonucleoside-diphosphate reductase alpha chain [Patescibacteria group bacterium]|jgi:ribonucleoside-diphosphate reductase alpha chain|nr:ribonucleoside-diphosphate reductase alpha chain [Patescibacteria group bacterium]
MYWLNENSKKFLSKGYLMEGVTAEQRIRDIAETAEKYLNKPGFADKFYDYMSRGFYSLASPVWSNYGLKRGLPISCFSSYIADDMSRILYTHAEVGMMTKYGGGTAGHFAGLRPRGAPIKDNGYSSGSVHFMELFDNLINIVSQGSVRRGHFAPYLPVEHKDIEEFLNIGTEGHPIQESTYAVTVTDAWLKEMVDGDQEKRRTWAKIIQRRTEIGYPYILFSDTVNNNTVDVYKDKKMKIHGSNLCSEICLPTSDEISFVCCLSSINIRHYKEWKDTDAVETLAMFLDTVITDFLENLEELKNSEDPQKQSAFYFMQRAYKFAKEHRALGLGVLGWHTYLQENNIALESPEASALNVEIFKLIKDRSYKASADMAKEYGEPEILKGYGRRNTTLLAIAPTTSSAFILGQVSQGIEPYMSNAFVKDVDKMKVTIKNPALVELLETKGQNTQEVWNSIRDNDGSVQHLTFLTPHEKMVFRTFSEIDQKVIIEQAAARQKYIDQAQSLNLMVDPSMPAKELNSLYLYAWEMGVKTLYYQHSMNAAQVFGRKKLMELSNKNKNTGKVEADQNANVCISCEA